MKRPRFVVLAAVLSSLATASADVTFEEKPDRVTVNINGSLFTEYRHGDMPNVYYWPLIGPGGAKMTRSFPMEKVEGEETDHKHHRSLWFSHGLVNGADFWSDPPAPGGKSRLPVGRTEHVKVLAMEPGKNSGVLKTSQKWIMPGDGSVALNSIQTLTVFAGPDNERMFDFDVKLTAGEKDVVFGETKEGSAGLRIAESMRFKLAKGAPGLGHILSNEGLEDDKVWGQPANWVTMFGPIGGQEYAITFMDHPSNLRHPARWHARVYGLFAANPFGGSSMDKTLPKDSGAYTLKAGESITLKYRILITQGETSRVRVQERFDQYAKSAH
jgi:hypothetical protein